MKTVIKYLEEKGFMPQAEIKMTPNHSGSHMSIEDLIKDYSKNLLSDFFNSKSDANISLEASQQEQLEKDFKYFVENGI